MLNYLKLNKFAVTMSAQSRTYNRKNHSTNVWKKINISPFWPTFLRIFHTNYFNRHFTPPQPTQNVSILPLQQKYLTQSLQSFIIRGFVNIKICSIFARRCIMQLLEHKMQTTTQAAFSFCKACKHYKPNEELYTITTDISNDNRYIISLFCAWTRRGKTAVYSRYSHHRRRLNPFGQRRHIRSASNWCKWHTTLCVEVGRTSNGRYNKG
jgi:hypothetical protein